MKSFRVRPRTLGALLLAVLLSTLIGGGALLAPTAQAEDAATTRTVTIPATRTTYTSSAATTKNFSTATTLFGSKTMYASYLGFDKLTLASGESITDASLNLNVTSVGGSGSTDVTVVPVNNSWTAAKVTYAARPAALGAEVNTTSTAPAGKTSALKLNASKVASQITTGASFEVRNTVSAAQLNFSATGAKAPTLTVTISTSGSSSNSSTSDKTSEATDSATDNGKMVFAHYFPPYPVSIDNKASDADYYARHYLVASGENGKYASVGGLLRDRPLTRDPISSNYKLADLKTEVRQAIDAGIDGFAVDILSLSGSNWDRTVLLMQAAEAVSSDFKIMLQVDATANAGKASDADLAAALATLSKYSSVYKVGGKVVISPFKAENKTASQWKSVLDLMKSKYSISTAFFPVFLNASKMSDYASISMGFGNWGARDPLLTANGPDYAAQAHKLGKLWMQPVAVQDERPNQKLYDEAGNTETLRAGWDKAISQDADWVLLTTWNDYSEGTSFAPSDDHGYSFLDISKYYATQFKTDAKPAITSDVIYVTHRIQSYKTKPSYSGVMVQWSGNRTTPRDTVELLTFLKASTTVSVKVGSKSYSYTAPAGVSAKTFALETGYTTVTATRSGSTVASVKTKDAVTATVTQQDLSYHAVSSSGR
ncbi:endo-1,3-alpha-glucanase family glycosylhydrolase [Tessaracoccus palaemonis]|uniref:DNRLRE domain-containing protein n=1 Tax=Tessaracoccus palaemonis TaxID=2829499 RepID=A0ABX8SJ66_9ACTN|nr:endo-1,3-alpha-glucanase family glycosylhydrolase [Tessaracoccus palaemonis]QXT63427.1 DNRLRE domain-containing protein [Tessaracoccus palaemonis]